ncbi:MAG: DUF2190 family protein [Candidatus Nealsonbacteria bacterium]|nr:DUF2190 family protein [Candidatus Nealsonbacteria bacterium]
MPLAEFVQEGSAIDYTPGADVSAGDVVVQNDLVGVAKRDLPANILGALAVVGLFDFPKAASDGTDFLVGEAAYWDAGNERASTDDSGGTRPFLGKAAQSAVDDDDVVRLRLSPDIAPPSNSSPSSSGT